MRYDPAGKAAALAAAYDAMQGALAHADGASPVERALIRALPARYPQREAIEDQAPWDAAYADAMREVFRAHRDDLEVREVFAESIMNLTPWQMWNLKTGGIADGAGTAEAVEVLESAFRDIPASWSHPGLLHLYVHLMEMSPFPQRALRALPRRAGLQPEGDRRGPQVPGPRRAAERLRALPHPRLPLRGLRRHVPRPVPAGDGGGAGADRHHARGAPAHSLAADGRLRRRLPLGEAARAGALRQVARDRR